MKQSISLITAMALIAGFLLLPAAPALAQTCDPMGFVDPGHGWTILHGHVSSIAPGLGYVEQDDALNGVVVKITFSSPRSVSAVKFHEANLLGILSFPIDNGAKIFAGITLNPPGSPNQENDGITVTGPADHNITILASGRSASEVTIYLSGDAAEISSQTYDVTMGSVCIVSVPIATWTPSPTYTPLPTRTGTNTPLPSVTSTPASSPTTMDTATPETFTPPPSTTPAASNTPNPSGTSTLESSTTFTPMAMGPGQFSSPQAPDVCNNAPVQCGSYPLPNLPTSDLVSPAPSTLVGIASSVTPIPGAIGGGGTGTPSGSTTPDSLSDSVVSFSTTIAQIPLEQTPILYGMDGNIIDVENGANQIGANVGELFGVYRALQGLFLGRTGTLIALLLLIVGFIIVVRVILFALPIILRISQIIIGLIP